MSVRAGVGIGTVRAGLLRAGLCLSLLPSALFAQSSASYRIDEQELNAGGRPAQGVVASSPGYRISLDAIGGPMAGPAMGATSFHLGGGGLAGILPPPGEVTGLQVAADQQTLVWSPEPASNTYNVYSGLLSTLPGPYGACASAHVAGTTMIDLTVPGTGTGLFYLVTGVNRLREEGTKGRTSNGTLRGNPSPCP